MLHRYLRESIGYCDSEHATAFLAVLYAYNALILIAVRDLCSTRPFAADQRNGSDIDCLFLQGNVLAYLGRHVPSDFNDTAHVSLAMINVMQVDCCIASNAHALAGSGRSRAFAIRSR